MIESWHYYNHAALPNCAPHEEADLRPINDGSIWKGNFSSGSGKPLFARWITDWDCGHETKWWYVIKDEPFSVESLKAKRRYEITKGNRNFEVRVIELQDYLDELFEVTIEAYSGWDEKYRPVINKTDFKKTFSAYKTGEVLGAFKRENGRLCGYSVVIDNQTFAEFCIMRTVPKEEHMGINAAMVFGILDMYNSRLKDGFYINDGSRAIRHETQFQDYLEKYFGFRKAYCRLHLKYRWIVKVAVDLLFPFRKVIKGKTAIGSLINGVLTMEEIARQ